MAQDATAPSAGWDPGQYLQFADERLRPALDLLGRVPLPAPKRIVDLGCGAGNVTAVLKQRFPGAEVTGVDGSAPMLERARTAAPDCRFVQADIGAWHTDTTPDLIYSNAALHWIGGHDVLFPRLMSLLAPNGVLAVQMPAMHDAPFRRLQLQVAATGPWAPTLRGHASAGDILSAGEYWDLLKPHAATLHIWETTYLHPLSGEDPIVEWAAGSSLRPFLEPLNPELGEGFRRAYSEALRPHYPRRADGTTLLPFRRLFMVATRRT
jgi:trans-aconitate 2-methyltransferase